jgi:hypothetical protein
MPSDARLDGFANQAARLTIPPLMAETFFTVGAELGAHAAKNPTTYGITCNVAQLAAGSCLNAFLTKAGQKMWRRPLTADEVGALATLFTTTSAQGGPAEGVASVMQALLLSPKFLHRTELGTVTQAGAVTPLTDYEIASALSYLIWDAPPDDALFALASQAKLRDKAMLVAQARRMFELREKSEPAMNSFLQQWLYLENLPSSAKDSTAFPLVTPEISQDLSDELRLFTNSVLFDSGGDRSFKTLFTAGYTFVNARTAPLYGISGVSGNTMVRRDLDPTQRRGILSMVPFLWGHSNSEDTNLVGRGAYVRGDVMCHRIPLPPGGVPPGKFADANATGRQRLELHASDGACATCHAFFDGIGFALENYDAIGRFRTTEHAQTIDPTGTLPLPSEGNQLPGMAFTNFVDLITKLSDKPDAYACFAQQFGSYASGRDFPELDPCERDSLIKQFAAANYKIDELIMSVIGSPSFLDRRN